MVSIFLQWDMNNSFFQVEMAVLGSGLAILASVLLYLMTLAAKTGPAPTLKELELGNSRKQRMEQISESIYMGAKSFMSEQLIWTAVYVFVVSIIIGSVLQDWVIVVMFWAGILCSLLAGCFGLLCGTAANGRTAASFCDDDSSLGDGLSIAFNAGACHGFSVAGFGLMGIATCYYASSGAIKPLVGFGLGASGMSLLFRVGGGIFGKGVDVGCDLVGKVELDCSEDDSRNPATIADYVGDNLGDSLGMGADLFESYVQSLLAACWLAGTDSDLSSGKGVAFAFYVSAFGIMVSIFSIFFLKVHDCDQQDRLSQLTKSIRRVRFIASFLSIACALGSNFIIFNGSYAGWAVMGCVDIGCVAGLFMGITSNYYTSYLFEPTRTVSNRGNFGGAPLVIQGVGNGFLSTVFPIMTLVLTILGTYALKGNYGICLASIGMLMTLGVTQACSSMSPICDNAVGIATMVELPGAARAKVESLALLGTYTATSVKGLSVGTAVLTSLSLMNAFALEVGFVGTNVTNNILDPVALPGFFLGAVLPFVFAGFCVISTSKIADNVVVEAHNQFRDRIRPYAAILAKRGTPLEPVYSWPEHYQPDSQRCVTLGTRSAVRHLFIPCLLAILTPLSIGWCLGGKGLVACLIGGISTSFVLGVGLTNAGSALQSAKKFIESGGHSREELKKFYYGLAGVVPWRSFREQKKYLSAKFGVGSDVHNAANVGDQFGDPLKGSAGPSLNTLMKLICIYSLVFGNTMSVTAWGVNSWWIAVILLVTWAFISFLCYWFVVGDDYEVDNIEHVLDTLENKKRGLLEKIKKIDIELRLSSSRFKTAAKAIRLGNVLGKTKK